MNVVEIETYKDGSKAMLFECPGCGCMHAPRISGDKTKHPVWSFNNNKEKPTISPSILVRWVSIPSELETDENGKYMTDSTGRIKGSKDEVCHSFVKDGNIKFLDDCTHDLKGQTVPLNTIE